MLRESVLAAHRSARQTRGRRRSRYARPTSLREYHLSVAIPLYLRQQRTKHVHQTTSPVVLRCPLVRQLLAPEANVSRFAHRASFSPAEIHEHGSSPSPPASSTAIPTPPSNRVQVGTGSHRLKTQAPPIYCAFVRLHLLFSVHFCTRFLLLASCFSLLASRFLLLAFCFLHSQARKPTDTFDYCPSTRCKKTTRCNTSFCGFVEGDTEAPRGAVLWRHTEAPRGAVLWRHQRARVLEQEEDTEMRPRSEVAGREGQRGAQGVRGIEFV